MIPWDTFKTPQDAYEWAQKNMSVKDTFRGLWFHLSAPAWSRYWWVLDQHARHYVKLRRVRR